MNQKIRILGVEFNDFTKESILKFIQECIDSNMNKILANHNLHSVYLFNFNKDFREFIQNQQYIHADGMPLIFWAKLMGYKLSRNNRITFLDLINPLLSLASKNSYRFYYLGGKPGVAEKACSILISKYQNISFESSHGYFDINDKEYNDDLIQKINAFKPNILMVGMGMPRQEAWISKYHHRLIANVTLPSGAIFDYISGEVGTPPRWMGKIGLEWFFRLLLEPKRLFGRYVLEPIYLIPYFFKDIVKFKLKR